MAETGSLLPRRLDRGRLFMPLIERTHTCMSTANEYVIREARLADVPAIARLAGEFALYLRGLGDTTEFRLNADALERDGFGPQPAFGGVVAEMAGAVVGYLLYHDGYDTDAACRVLVVVDLFVTQAVRRRGAGAALMREASAVAVSRGARQLVWTVYQHNAEALRFYERIGGRYVQDLRLMCLDV
jgi:GNAT superfamily N-acetyltransferase